jgi:hypothetical protein
LNVIMATRRIGFSMHLCDAYIVAHFWEVVHMHSFWGVFTPKRSEKDWPAFVGKNTVEWRFARQIDVASHKSNPARPP